MKTFNALHKTLAGIITTAGADNKAYADGGYLGSGNRTETTVLPSSTTSDERGGYIGSSGRNVSADGGENLPAAADESEALESVIELILEVLF